MANYYRVSPKFWLFTRRRGWTDAQTSLGLYLLTCEHRNLEGLYRLPKPYVAADLVWSAKKVEENFAVVLESGFAVYDEDAEMVLIPKALKHQAPSTEKQIIGAVAQLERIPRTCLWDAFRMACQLHCPRLADAIEAKWPCDSNTRAGSISISSSNSISSSSPPLAPPATPGGNRDEPDMAPPMRANSRAHGTNPRNVDIAAVEQQSVAAGVLAASFLAAPSDAHRAEWERLRTALVQSVGGKAVMEGHIADLTLCGVLDGEFVIDGTEDAWGWARLRLAGPLEAWAQSLGIKARFASVNEHEGLRVAA